MRRRRKKEAPHGRSPKGYIGMWNPTCMEDTYQGAYEVSDQQLRHKQKPFEFVALDGRPQQLPSQVKEESICEFVFSKTHTNQEIDRIRPSKT